MNNDKSKVSEMVGEGVTSRSPGFEGTGEAALLRRVRAAAVLALLVGLFLFVPLLQGFDLSAGQGIPGRDPAAAATAAADKLASDEVTHLAARP
jgi:hypothetical protein